MKFLLLAPLNQQVLIKSTVTDTFIMYLQLDGTEY